MAALYNEPLAEDRLDGYLVSLAGYRQDVICEAIAEAAKACRFFPRPSDIIEHIPQRQTNTFLPEADRSDADVALAADLGPLWITYLEGGTSLTEWVGQMQYFADKHGVGSQMKYSIRENLPGAATA